MIDIAIATLLRNAITATSKAQVRPATETTNVLKDALPIIIYSFIDLDRGYTDSGPNGIVTGFYNLDIYTNKGTEARQIADTIRTALDGYNGTTDDTQIVRIYFDREKLLQGSLREGSNQTLARYAIEMKVAFRQ